MPPWLPVRVRQWPQFLRQLWQRQRVLARPPAHDPVFRLCFFSCESYHRYLYCALHSLKHAAAGRRLEIWLFSDQDMPVTEAQAAELRALVPSLRVIPWPKSMGWGVAQIESIWAAYALASEGAHPQDIIARVDADVFFFNDRIFDVAARSAADFVGDGHFVDFRYCQGGCYFLRAHAVRQVLALLQREPMAQIAREVDIVVEDVVASHLVRRAGLSTQMTWFMAFPDELRLAGGLTAWMRFKFSCAHFVMKNKQGMLVAYREQVLRGNVPGDYALVAELATAK